MSGDGPNPDDIEDGEYWSEWFKRNPRWGTKGKPYESTGSAHVLSEEQAMTGSYLTGVNLGALREAIRADLGVVRWDVVWHDDPEFIDALPWTHVLELVQNLLADKTRETAEQLASAVQTRLAEVVRQYNAIYAKRTET